jgi:S1-C subfamily serine protease
MGDVVVSANGQRIATEQDFDDLIAEGGRGDKIVVGVARRSGTRVERRFVTIVAP